MSVSIFGILISQIRNTDEYHRTEHGIIIINPTGSTGYASALEWVEIVARG
jgi:hypothetical protein